MNSGGRGLGHATEVAHVESGLIPRGCWFLYVQSPSLEAVVVSFGSFVLLVLPVWVFLGRFCELLLMIFIPFTLLNGLFGEYVVILFRLIKQILDDLTKMFTFNGVFLLVLQKTLVACSSSSICYMIPKPTLTPQSSVAVCICSKESCCHESIVP